jgi:hypothetical protein
MENHMKDYVKFPIIYLFLKFLITGIHSYDILGVGML